MSYSNVDKKYQGYIYVISNDINDYKYVGQTINNLSKRFREHINEANFGGCNSILHNAILKYGKEHFYINEISRHVATTKNELIDILSSEEVKWISKLNTIRPNGYNILEGGNRPPIQELRPIDQYSKNGKLLKSFSSIIEACESLDRNASSSHISECCRGILCTAYGYIWRYKDEPFNKYAINDNRTVSVDQYSLDGELLNTYSTIIEIPSEICNCLSSVSACCKGKLKTTSGYVWRYHNEPFDKYSVKYKKKSGKTLYVYDESFNFVNKFKSYTDFGDFIGLTKHAVRRHINTNKIWNGYYLYDFLLNNQEITE